MTLKGRVRLMAFELNFEVIEGRDGGRDGGMGKSTLGCTLEEFSDAVYSREGAISRETNILASQPPPPPNTINVQLSSTPRPNIFELLCKDVNFGEDQDDGCV